jgi:hypothetical protein
MDGLEMCSWQLDHFDMEQNQAESSGLPDFLKTIHGTSANKR